MQLQENSRGVQAEAFRLHIGGMEPRDGWKILDIKPGPFVDFIGGCTDLGQFADNSINEIYASHVYEHLSHLNELRTALLEANRILVPGASIKISVPDFELLCRMFLHPALNLEQRFALMRIIFGGQTDDHDYHKIGLTWEFLTRFLKEAGFINIKRVTEFGLFNDCSAMRIGDKPFTSQLISLNVEAIKPPLR